MENSKMADSPEESSWTFYIDGFMCDQDNDDGENEMNFSCSSDYESPSLISDAASSPVKRFKNLNFTEGLGFSPRKGNRILGKQISFKKQKNTIMPVMDLELEDTASSPVNSPRVSHMNQFMNQKEKGNLDVNEVHDEFNVAFFDGLGYGEFNVRRNIFAKGGVVNVDKDNAYTTQT